MNCIQFLSIQILSIKNFLFPSGEKGRQNMLNQNDRDNSREDGTLISNFVDNEGKVLEKQVREEKKKYDWKVVEID